MDVVTMVSDVRRRAARFDYVWDERAVDWPDLPPGATVIDVGGYTGRWALQMADRYQPRLFVFEPQPWAAAVCTEALGGRATVLPYGLGDRTDRMLMGAWETDGASLVKPGAQWVEIREIRQAFRALKIKTIDLMLMNIEGYEYTLLPHMFDRGIRPRRLLVQWHPFTLEMQETGRAIDALRTRLGYRVLWDYGAVLSAWEIG